MLRRTAATAGLIGIASASPVVVERQHPGTRAAVIATGLLAANAYLPVIIKDVLPVPSRTLDPNCRPCYPEGCIPPPPSDLDSGEIPFCRFHVVGCDPLGFDGAGEGVGCEV